MRRRILSENVSDEKIFLFFSLLGKSIPHLVLLSGLRGITDVVCYTSYLLRHRSSIDVGATLAVALGAVGGQFRPPCRGGPLLSSCPLLHPIWYPVLYCL